MKKLSKTRFRHFVALAPLILLLPAFRFLPSIQLSPSNLDFKAKSGGTNPDPQDVSLTNPNGSTTTLNWTVASNKPWLHFQPLSGTTRTQVSTISATAIVSQAEAWTAATTLVNAPAGRENFSMAWTGKYMIVWGGTTDFNGVITNDGALYDPAQDVWVKTTSFVGAPSPRIAHKAIWTGSKMLLWGGRDNSTYFNVGYFYDPTTDTWSGPTSTVNAPSARVNPSIVWTGTEMIVWGGLASDGVTELNDGGRYVPITDTWTSVSTTNAPSGRDDHVAVWTSSQMIVWGGYDGTQRVNDGKRYNPVQDSWGSTLSTVNAPPAVSGASATWDGSEMIVWGGDGNVTQVTNLGGRYDPAANSWTPTTTTNALSARRSNLAIWAGHQMIVWGGYSPAGGFMNSGQRYVPPISLAPGTYVGTLTVSDPNASNSPQKVSVSFDVH